MRPTDPPSPANVPLAAEREIQGWRDSDALAEGTFRPVRFGETLRLIYGFLALLYQVQYCTYAVSLSPRSGQRPNWNILEKVPAQLGANSRICRRLIRDRRAVFGSNRPIL